MNKLTHDSTVSTAESTVKFPVLCEKISQHILQLQQSPRKKPPKKQITPGRLKNILEAAGEPGNQPGEVPAEVVSCLVSQKLELQAFNASHLDLFNAVAEWVNKYRSHDFIETVWPGVKQVTGEMVFCYLSPVARGLAGYFPDCCRINRIKDAFTVDCAVPEMWSSEELLESLIFPWLNVRGIVFTVNRKDNTSSVTVYEPDGTVTNSEPDDSVFHDIHSQQQIILYNDKFCWRVAFPVMQ